MLEHLQVKKNSEIVNLCSEEEIAHAVYYNDFCCTKSTQVNI